ncbi:MAG: alginate lyase family protein [Pseudomonadota bacterium]
MSQAGGGKNGIALYFNTLRYLRLSQVAARLSGRVPRRLPSPGPLLLRRHPVSPPVPPLTSPPVMLGPSRFRFLNVEAECVGPRSWQIADSRLWLYNLHYFDDLNATGAASRSLWHDALLRRWVAENPPGEGPGWEPYPLSRRLVNWIKWANSGHALPPECEASLPMQARWLAGALEYHLLGNHLLANAKALIFAGLHFEGADAARWFRTGWRILRLELREQILEDGGHFELSPMYHCTVLEDLLDIANLCAAHRVVPFTPLQDAINRMRGWLRVMQHPDRQIPFFNDAAFLVAAPPADLEAYSARSGLPELQVASNALATLTSSGYVRAQAGLACLLLDCAAVGPDYQPGHAHADTLSFEMSLGVQRVFVNSGTSRYGSDAERQRQRGTAAHNTVSIDGQDSSEVWAGFRVARRARARLDLATAAGDIVVEASHDGYCRLPGRNVHRRRWILGPQALRIEDHISGAFTNATAHFHLHPDIRISAVSSNSATLALRGGHTIDLSFEGLDGLRVEDGTWHPEFGLSIANQVLRARLAASALVTHVRWSATA